MNAKIPSWTSSTHLMLACALVGAVGCDGRGEIEVPPPPPPEVVATPMELPDPIDLTSPPEQMQPTQLSYGDAHVWQPCHDLLEPRQIPQSLFPYQDEPRERAEAFFGCEIDAHLRTDDGRRYLAYGLPREALGGGERTVLASSRPMRVIAYDAEGARRWSVKIDRKASQGSFVASNRGTFITDVPPHLVCAGTQWEQDVEVHCFRDATGDAVWEGRLPYWSGIAPQGHDKSLMVADLSGLRMIYPWTGVERRFKKLAGPGGRSSLYQTDGDSLYFSSNRDAPLTLTAYDFDDLEPRWIKKLGGKLDPIWSHVFPEHQLLVVHQDERLIGLDTASGQTRWVLGVGKDSPPMAASEDAIHVLVRRAEGPNLLHALDPRTGEHLWWAEPPTGTLRLAHEEGLLMLGSVRAVQRVSLPKPVAQGDLPK